MLILGMSACQGLEGSDPVTEGWEHLYWFIKNLEILDSSEVAHSSLLEAKITPFCLKTIY